MEWTSFSERFPPKNRVDTGLAVIQIEIVGADGVHRTDASGAAVMGFKRLLPVKEPVKPSVLSGEPGFLYRTYDGVEMALTAEEMLRLMRRELRPQEVLKLHSIYGAFFETHFDFYSENTGQAFQPMSARE